MCCWSAIFDTMEIAFTQIPMIVLFQKMVPDNVEATMMAIAAGVINFSRGTMPEMSGIFFNQFIGLSDKNLTTENYKWVQIIPLLFTFWELLIIRLIPLNSDIEL